MKGTKYLFKRLLATVLALIMMLTYIVAGESTTSYAKISKATAKTAINVDAISVSYKINYAYEGQKFNETTFRKNATVKAKKNGKTSTIKAYTVSAPTYVRANGTGKNKGKFVIKVTYGGKSAYFTCNLRKIAQIYVKSSDVTMLENGSNFNARSFKQKTTVYAKYKVGKTYTEHKLPSYTVYAEKKVSANSKKHKGYYKVTLKYGSKSTIRYINVITGIKATSSYKFLNENEKIDARSLKNSLSVKRIFATGKTSTIPAKDFKLVDCPTIVRSNSTTHPGYIGIKVRSGNRATYAYVKVNSFNGIVIKSNSDTTLTDGMTFNEKDFRSQIVVSTLNTISSTNKEIKNYTVSVPSKTVKPDSNGTYVITVSYNGKSTKVAVPVIAKPIVIEEIEATLSNDFNLNEGDIFDETTFRNNVTIYATYSDDNKKVITDYTIEIPDRMVSPDDNDNFIVTITYDEKQINVVVPVITKPIVLEKIEVSLADGFSLKERDLFDEANFRNNITVYAIYSNGTKETIADYTVKAPTYKVYPDSNGIFEITITYNEKKTKIAVTVIPDTPTHNFVDWVGYNKISGEPYIDDPDENGIICIYAAMNVPGEYQEIYEVAHWGVIFSKTDPEPTWDSPGYYNTTGESSYSQSYLFGFPYDNEDHQFKNGELIYFRSYVALKKKSDTSNAPKKYYFYSNQVLPITIRDNR